MKNAKVAKSALRRQLLPSLIAACFGGTAAAAPTGGQVIHGQATFNQQGKILSITNTPGTIINWQSFSIGRGETTKFIQENAKSTVLNRITGQDPSKILGALQSNGRVFLVNPNGVLFGKGAKIDVKGLVASSLNISNDDFLNGKLNFNGGANAGSVKNQGAITTPNGGQVYLIAPDIENTGIITSPKGEVLLAAGRTVHLVDSLDPNLQVVVSAPDNEAINLGTILTQGGKTGIYGALIRQRGVINADSAVVGENGKIVFKSSGDTLLEAGSKTTARGAGKGGEVIVQGKRVGLMGDALIDVSGQKGGGTALIGGDYQGKNPAIANAEQTYLSGQSVVKADAVQSGNGGKVIAWGDETTQVYGSISARGGAASGNGGFIETSGHYLDMRGKVDARAPHGKNGQLLLDPYDIEISNSQPGGTTSLSGTDAFSPGMGQNSWLKTSTLLTALNSADVTVMTNSNSGYGGSITVKDTLAYTGSNSRTLTLMAYGGDININAPISSSNSALNLTLHADEDIATNGSTISLKGGNLNMFAGGAIGTASKHIKAAASTVTATAGNVYVDNSAGAVRLKDLGFSANVDVAASGAVTVYSSSYFTNTLALNGKINAGTTITAEVPVALNGEFNSGGNQTYSLLQVTGNATLKSTSGTITANQAGISYSATLALNGKASFADFDNQGAVRVGSGTLTLGSNETVYNDGLIEVAAGAKVKAQGGLYNEGVLAGDGTIVANVTNDGTIAPGTNSYNSMGGVGTLTIDGNFEQASYGGDLIFDLGGNGNDRLVVTGNAALNRSYFTFNLLDDFAPVENKSLSLVRVKGNSTFGESMSKYAYSESDIWLIHDYQFGYWQADGEALRMTYVPFSYGEESSANYFTNKLNTLNWNDPGNWSNGVVPSAYTYAYINSDRAVQHSSGTHAVASLILDGKLKVSGGSLTIGEQSDFGYEPALFGSGRIDVSGGTLNLNGNSEIDTLAQSGGKVNLNGPSLIVDTLTQSGGFLTQTGTQFEQPWFEGNQEETPPTSSGPAMPAMLVAGTYKISGSGVANLAGYSKVDTYKMSGNGVVNLTGFMEVSEGFSQTGGTIDGKGTGWFSATGSFKQSGNGAINNMGTVSVTSESDLIVGSIGADFLSLTSEDGSISSVSGKTLRASTLYAQSRRGMDLNTRAGILDLVNTGTTGDIKVSNTGENLVVSSLIQTNGKGSISLTSTGAVTVGWPSSSPSGPESSAMTINGSGPSLFASSTTSSDSSPASVYAGSGNVSIIAGGALTVNGSVQTGSGSIALQAGTTPPSPLNIFGTVNSGSGNIVLAAGGAITGTATTGGKLVLLPNGQQQPSSVPTPAQQVIDDVTTLLVNGSQSQRPTNGVLTGPLPILAGVNGSSFDPTKDPFQQMETGGTTGTFGGGEGEAKHASAPGENNADKKLAVCK